MTGQYLYLHDPTGKRRPLRIYTDITQTAEEMRIGLSGRKNIPDFYGMLFKFPKGARPSMWMKATYVPLDIAFLDNSGVVLSIEPGEPHNVQSIYGPEGSVYALEVRGGLLSRFGVQSGFQLSTESRAK
jgi:uncharacterized membrane protein (UPF0127 family)